MDPVRPTMMDRLIGAISPRQGARRLAERAVHAQISATVTDQPGEIGRRSGYRAGRSDRRQTKGWFARPQSANTDAIARRKDLIGRSRDAAMNLPPATAAIERNVTFAIGTGLMALPDLDADVLGLTPEEAAAWTKRIRRDFDNYMSSTDPDAERSTTGYGLQEVVLRGQLESGDVLGLRCWPDDQIGRVHMTAWKLYEADRVVSPFNHIDGKRLNGSGAVVVGGVEQDGWGAAVAYHVLRQAPGPNMIGRTANDTDRFPAWGAETKLPSALLVFDKRRAEQARGIPLLAPVLEMVKIFSDATDAAALSLVLQSMLAVIYKSPGATAFPEPEYGTGEIVQADYEPETVGRPTASDVKMEAGMVLEIDTDADVKNVSPDESPVYEKFFEAILTQIGAAIGTPFGVLMARFNNSYTASKGEMELFYREVHRRVERFAAGWCAPGYQCWMYERVARGYYDLPGFLDDLHIRAAWCSVRWAGDGKISLDPLRERKAFEIDEAHGWQTGQQIAAQINGGDFDANIERRGEEHRRFVEAGLPVPGLPGQGGGQGGGSGAADPGEGQQNGDGNAA